MVIFSFLGALVLVAASFSCWSKLAKNQTESTMLGDVKPGWNITYLSVEELVHGLPPEGLALDALTLDLSSLLLAQTIGKGSGVLLSEVLLVRLGNLLGLLRGDGGSLSGRGIGGLSGGSRGGLLILSILLTLYLG
jgi:hypothetical protein